MLTQFHQRNTMGQLLFFDIAIEGTTYSPFQKISVDQNTKYLHRTNFKRVKFN